jgi:hypothetical protein
LDCKVVRDCALGYLILLIPIITPRTASSFVRVFLGRMYLFFFRFLGCLEMIGSN